MKAEEIVNINVQLKLSDDRIESGDLFFFYQYGGLPTIRRAKDKEDWNDWSSNPYKKIVAINGILISPKVIFGNLTSFI